MTHPQDNARAAAEIVVEQRHRDAAATVEPNGRERDQILRGKRDRSPIVIMIAAFERDHMLRLTDTVSVEGRG